MQNISSKDSMKEYLQPYYKSLKGTTLYRKANLAKLYLQSLRINREEQEVFRGVETYCMFVGHATSGHSVVGALLDAHPNIMLPDEMDTLKLVSAGFSREQIYHLLLERSRLQASRGRMKIRRTGQRSSYAVPGQWQGRYEKLMVIGASKAGTSSREFAAEPTLLPRVYETFPRVKFIHVVRNPYDNISTLSLKKGLELQYVIDFYFSVCEGLAELYARVGLGDLLIVRQEDIVEEPAGRLLDMCKFLGVGAEADYLAACASVVYKSPVRSRREAAWSAPQLEQVRRQIERFDFLRGYSYDE